MGSVLEISQRLLRGPTADFLVRPDHDSAGQADYLAILVGVLLDAVVRLDRAAFAAGVDRGRAGTATGRLLILGIHAAVELVKSCA